MFCIPVIHINIRSNPTPNPTPGALGYRMPAEWEQHTATWIAWPHNASDWPGRFHPIPWVYAEIVRQLAAVEQVHILVQNADAEKRARGELKRKINDLRPGGWTDLSGGWLEGCREVAEQLAADGLNRAIQETLDGISLLEMAEGTAALRPMTATPESGSQEIPV